jgi:hypothetical protein
MSHKVHAGLWLSVVLVLMSAHQQLTEKTLTGAFVTVFL